MVHAKNYDTVSTFGKVMQRNSWIFFPDMLYIEVL